MDCSRGHGWCDDYGLYRHGESWWRVVFVDEWCFVVHGNGVDEWDDIHIHRHSNECGRDK